MNLVFTYEAVLEQRSRTQAVKDSFLPHEYSFEKPIRYRDITSNVVQKLVAINSVFLNLTTTKTNDQYQTCDNDVSLGL